MADPKVLDPSVWNSNYVPPSQDQFYGQQFKPQQSLVEKILKLFYSPSDPGVVTPMPMMLTTPVYHGTNQVFNEFLNSKLAKDTLYGVGHYFTDSPQVASGYALNKVNYTPQIVREGLSTYDARLAALQDKLVSLIKRGPDSYDLIRNTPDPTYPNVHKVFLDIDNPFNTETDRLTKQQLEKLNIKSISGALDYLKSKFPGMEEKFPEMLSELGYDSLVYPGGKMYSGVTPHRVFVVNDPSKILSAFSDKVVDAFKNAKTLLK